METKHFGLTTHEAQKRLKEYGKNILPHKKPVSDLLLLFDQIKSPLIYILLIASLISFILGDYKDALVILAAVFINTFLGFYQERKAQRALYALKQVLIPTSKVIRDGKVVTINSSDLVPGDVVLLTTGDQVPADGQVLEETNLLVNEAVLTGESVPVAKEAIKTDLPTETRESSVSMGTTVTSGRGKILITKTGLKTEFGKIASELYRTEEEKTPLQKKLDAFARFLAIMVGVLSLSILIVGLARGKPFIEMFTTSVALSVAAIPEGMAVSLTAILALSMQRILKRKALVRKLVAAEALGSVTIIATDKTGTLTEGMMAVVKAQFSDENEVIKAAALANNREDPLEIALWEYVQKRNQDPQYLQDSNLRVGELLFDASRKYMATLYKEAEADYTLYIKGAPEILLAKTSLMGEEKAKWLGLAKKWGSEGLRLIGFAKKKLAKVYEDRQLDKEVNQIEWLGLVGIADPVRETVKEALKDAQRAGIKLKVVTGDYSLTSLAVLKKLGITVSGTQILEGEEIEKLSLEELKRKVDQVVLFSRVTPLQKSQIVNILREKGEVIALLGDGINDAPAIKAANIGVVVNESTDVAKETADMVLLDSNFKTIVAAIEEGRSIYENIKKVILYLLSDSFAEILLVFGSIILGLPLPLTAAQILWINIVTDGFPNLALTVEPKDKNLLSRPPISSKAELLDTPMKVLIIIISTVTGIFSLGLFMLVLKFTSDLKLARTIIFVALGINSLFYVFSVRTLTYPLWQDGLFSNKWLLWAVGAGFLIQLIPLYHPFFQSFLETYPLSLTYWLIVLLGPLMVIVLIEFIKMVLIKPEVKVQR